MGVGVAVCCYFCARYFTYAMADLVMCGYRSKEMCANLVQRGFFDAPKRKKKPVTRAMLKMLRSMVDLNDPEQATLWAAVITASNARPAEVARMGVGSLISVGGCGSLGWIVVVPV